MIKDAKCPMLTIIESRKHQRNREQSPNENLLDCTEQFKAACKVNCGIETASRLSQRPALASFTMKMIEGKVGEKHTKLKFKSGTDTSKKKLTK